MPLARLRSFASPLGFHRYVAAVVFSRAGKVRGHVLANELGVAGSNVPTEQIAAMLDGAVGKDGTCLTGVKSVTKEGDKYIVDCFDTVCSAGEPQLGESARSCCPGPILISAVSP